MPTENTGKSPFMTKDGRIINPACGIMEYYRRAGFDFVEFWLDDDTSMTVVLHSMMLVSGTVMPREFSPEEAPFHVRTDNGKAFYFISSEDFSSELHENITGDLLSSRIHGFADGAKKIGPETAKKFNCEWIDGPSVTDIIKMQKELGFFLPVMVLKPTEVLYQNAKFFVVDQAKLNYRLVWKNDMELPVMPWYNNRTPIRLMESSEKHTGTDKKAPNVPDENAAFPSEGILKIIPKKSDLVIRDPELRNCYLKMQDSI